MRANRSDHAYVSLRKRSKLCLLCSAVPALQIAAAPPVNDVRRLRINSIALTISARSRSSAPVGSAEFAAGMKSRIPSPASPIPSISLKRSRANPTVPTVQFVFHQRGRQDLLNAQRKNGASSMLAKRLAFSSSRWRAAAHVLKPRMWATVVYGPADEWSRPKIF